MLERFADIRYAGQSYELTIPWPHGDFHKEHGRVYGYSDAKRATQIVTLRLRATVRVEKLLAAGRARKGEKARAKRGVSGSRGDGVRSQRLSRGPALIADYGSTTLVPAGWSIRQDLAGKSNP